MAAAMNLVGQNGMIGRASPVLSGEALLQKRSAVSHERLLKLLRYDPETGVFTQLLKTPKGRPVGSVCGVLLNGAYLEISVDGRRYLAHRLAWFYMTGEWPSSLVDHEDRNGLNNKWSNLRDASAAQNACNSKTRVDNKLGVKGVILRNGNFLARISLGGKRKILGHFQTLEEARQAYADAARVLHGEFASPT